MQWLFYIFIVSIVACSKGEQSEAKPVKEDAVSLQKAADAMLPNKPSPPKREDALTLLKSFANAISSQDLTEASTLIRVPDTSSTEEIERYLRRLFVNGHLDIADQQRWESFEFGSLSERFGKSAEHIAKRHELSAEKIYALGGPDGGAIFVRDGDDELRVVAVHRLGGPPNADEPL